MTTIHLICNIFMKLYQLQFGPIAFMDLLVANRNWWNLGHRFPSFELCSIIQNKKMIPGALYSQRHTGCLLGWLLIWGKLIRWDTAVICNGNEKTNIHPSCNDITDKGDQWFLIRYRHKGASTLPFTLTWTHTCTLSDLAKCHTKNRPLHQ